MRSRSKGMKRYQRGTRRGERARLRSLPHSLTTQSKYRESIGSSRTASPYGIDCSRHVVIFRAELSTTPASGGSSTFPQRENLPNPALALLEGSLLAYDSFRCPRDPHPPSPPLLLSDHLPRHPPCAAAASRFSTARFAWEAAGAPKRSHDESVAPYAVPHAFVATMKNPWRFDGRRTIKCKSNVHSFTIPFWTIVPPLKS